MSTPVPGIVLIAIVALATLGAIFNWWIITRSRRLFNMLLGDKAARIINSHWSPVISQRHWTLDR